MDFFDKLGKKASETYKVTAEKTGKIARSAKIKIQIGELKSDVADLQSEIGEKVFNAYSDGKTTIDLKKDLEAECKKIDKMNKEIKKLKKECLELDDKKECPNCHAQINREIKFCPECGTKQPIEKKEPAKEVEVVEKKETKKQTQKTTPKTTKPATKVKTPKADSKSKEELAKTVKVESSTKKDENTNK